MGKRGKPLGWRAPGSKERNDAIMRLHRDSELSFTEIGEHFGLSKQRVHQIILDQRRKSLDDLAALK